MYDSSVGGNVSGTVTDSGGTLIKGTTVVLEGTSFTATTDINGGYTIMDVPDPVTYDVTVSAAGLPSSTVGRLTVDGPMAGVDFSLTSRGVGGEVHVADTNPTVHPKNGRLIITHVIHDAAGNPVVGATVESNLNRDGTNLGTASETTNDNGEVSFRLRGATPEGDYVSTVVDITGDGVSFSACNTRPDGSIDESKVPYNITGGTLTQGAPIDDCSL